MYLIFVAVMFHTIYLLYLFDKQRLYIRQIIDLMIKKARMRKEEVGLTTASCLVKSIIKDNLTMVN